MVRHLLSLVLCLLAAVPQGVCTCAAGATPCRSSTPPAPVTPERPAAHGRCHHDSHPGTPGHEGDTDGPAARSPAAPTHGHQDHAPACRAVVGDPAGVRVASVAAECSPAEVGPAPLGEQAGANPGVLAVRAYLAPPPPKLPLFLALGVLRN